MTNADQIKTNIDADWGKAASVDEKLNILCSLMAELTGSKKKLGDEITGKIQSTGKDIGTKLDKLGSDIVSTIQMASSTLNLHAERCAQQQREQDALFGEDRKAWAYDLRAGWVEGPFRRQVPTSIGGQYGRKPW